MLVQVSSGEESEEYCLFWMFIELTIENVFLDLE